MFTEVQQFFVICYLILYCRILSMQNNNNMLLTLSPCSPNITLGHRKSEIGRPPPITYFALSDLPLCQGMKALIQSRSIEQRCTSP